MERLVLCLAANQVGPGTDKETGLSSGECVKEMDKGELRHAGI